MRKVIPDFHPVHIHKEIANDHGKEPKNKDGITIHISTGINIVVNFIYNKREK